MQTSSPSLIHKTCQMLGLDRNESTLRAIVSGTAAGMCGKVVEYPADSVKVRLQADTRFAGAMDCIRSTFRKEGLFAFYQGMTSPLFGAAAENAALFLIYRKAEKILRPPDISAKDPLPMSRVVLAGLCAGLGTTVVLTPVELIKCKMQVMVRGKTGKPTGPIDVIKDIVNKEGLKGLFRGGTSTMLREVPGNGIWFGTYEFVCRALSQGKSTSEAQPWMQITAGASAGAMYWLIPYPFDSVKSRIQTMANPQPFLTVFKDIIHNHGIKYLYRGVGITVGRAIPSNAVIFFVYETVSKWFATL